MKHYVYKLTDLETDCYYIGMRSNKDPYNDSYMGSYAAWNPTGELKKDILIILPSRKMAAIVEQSIIEENIDNDLCMNAVVPNIMQTSKVLTLDYIIKRYGKTLIPVLQYSLDGKFIREWEGVNIAAEGIGVSQPTLSHALSDDNYTAGGFLWRYKESDDYKKNITKHHYTLINQYDLDGNFIKQWNGLMEIEKKKGYKNPNIVACCRGRHKTAYGYVWKYANK